MGQQPRRVRRDQADASGQVPTAYVDGRLDEARERVQRGPGAGTGHGPATEPANHNEQDRDDLQESLVESAN
jgi:hypothetical protein